MDLESNFRQLIQTLALIRTEAKTTAWNPMPGSGERELPLRRLEQREDPSWWLEWWTEQRFDNGRREVLEQLQVQVTKLRFAPPRQHRRGTQEHRETVATDPRSAKEVAILYRVPLSTVYRWRQELRKVA